MRNIFKKARNTTDYVNPAPRKLPRVLGTVVLLIAVLVVMGNAVEVIPSGFTGVVTTFGQIQEKPMPNGFNWKIPFVQEVLQVNNKQQDIYLEGQIWSEASDQTVVYLEGVTVTYQILPERSAWIFANVSDYTNNLVSRTLVDSALKTAAKSLASEDVTNRGLIEPAARESLQAAMDEKYGADTVKVIKVVIANMDFEERYNEAIEARQLARMEQERQQIENATNLARAQAEADAARIEAQGKAEAETILAQAKADANEILSASITERTQTQDMINSWNGVLPSTFVTDGENGLFKMFSITPAQTENAGRAAPAASPSVESAAPEETTAAQESAAQTETGAE